MATRRAPRRPLDCHERALRLLAVRPRSRRELGSRLRSAGFEAVEVEAELVRLEEVGLLDDGAFARELADHHLTVRRSGRRAVAEALAAKGVSRATIGETLAGLEGDETERAVRIARDRARRLMSLRPEVAYGRLVSFLARRGYDGGTSRRAARVALGLDGGQD
jgi:regulatory protein